MVLNTENQWMVPRLRSAVEATCWPATVSSPPTFARAKTDISRGLQLMR